MSWIEFVAQSYICQQAVEKALPEIREQYKNDNLDTKTVTETISSKRLMERQRELRQGRVIGRSYEADTDLVDQLASEVSEMYEENL